MNSSTRSERREAQLVTTNFNLLMKAVAERCPGGSIPNDYLVIDLETTGFPNPRRAEYVVQFGYAVVQGRQMTDNYSTLLKTPPNWITPGASEVTGITDEMIQKDGQEPAAFYTELIKLLELYRSSGSMFVGHNLKRFDCPFLEANFKHYGFDFAFGPDEIIDTGMLFKASQLFAAPADDEKLGAFFDRVGQTRSRAKWNLGFSAQRLGLDMKYGIDLSEAHDAAFDCRLTHLLLEELRRLADVTG